MKKNKKHIIDNIDFISLNDEYDKNHSIMMKKLEQAVTATGFLIIKNSPISRKTFENLLNEYKVFFKKPLKEKNKVNMSLTESNRGWGGSLSEQVNSDYNPDFKEIYDCGPEIDFNHKFKNLSYYATNIWPDDMPKLKDLAENFYQECNSLGIQILNKIAKILKLSDTYFSDKFDLPMALLRCNFYPERPNWAQKEDFGIAPHTDYGCLTLLFTEGDPGLEIKTLDGTWEKIISEKGDIIVNFGDMLQFWSDNQVKATQHRVIGTNKSRYSIPFFFNPRHDTIIKENNNKPHVLAGEYLAYKYDTTYRHKF